jgi:hypothetical protein
MISRSTGRVTSTSANKSKVKSIAEESQTEYSLGPVSRVASAVASASDAAQAIPVLQPFALATSIGARAVKSIASIFGWTNPPVIDNVLGRKDVPFHAIASPNISTPIEKLTLDPKNELTVDSRTVGLDGTDEMTFSSICTRSAYMFNCPWFAADPVEHVLCTINVGPQTYVATNPSTIVAFSPMSHLSQAFTYWRGDIIYEIRIACSKFHRGRLHVFWDPKNLASSSNDVTRIYNRLFDIEHDKVIEIRVPYIQDRPWKKIKNGGPSTPVFDNNFVAGSGALAYNAANFNGQLQLRVANLLRSPVDTTEVRIIVSARGAENLSFADPSHPSYNLANFVVQSGERIEGYNDDDIQPITNCHDPVDLNYLVTMGENVRSIRTLIRRCAFHRRVSLQADTTARSVIFDHRFGHFPFYFGHDPNGVHLNSLSEPLNYCAQTPLNWFAPCYLGYRGSVNYHFNVNSPEFVDSMTVIRAPMEVRNSSTYRGSVIEPVGANDSTLAYNPINFKMLGDTGGYALTNQKTQTGLSVQLPLYSPYRFRSADPTLVMLGSTIDESNIDSYDLLLQMKPAPSGHDSASSDVHVFVGAGTDFSFFYYLNAPMMWNGVIETPLGA